MSAEAAAGADAAAAAGWDTTSVGIAIAVIAIVIGLPIFLSKTGPRRTAHPVIELHPDQIKFVKEKEEKFDLADYQPGKGIRVVIDYLREAKPEEIQAVLGEKPKYSDGFEEFPIFLHDGQFEWLELQNIKLGEGEGVEAYADISKALRAIIDHTMRMEKENNNTKIASMYEEVRCLNC